MGFEAWVRLLRRVLVCEEAIAVGREIEREGK